MKRKIIHIDQTLCNGCGLCVDACHEGAIALVNGKARLMRDDYCDGLGDCLPACPTQAIHFEEREALPYDEAAVQAHMANRKQPSAVHVLPMSPSPKAMHVNWPIQIKLMSLTADYYQGRKLVIAADCTAFSYPRFQEEFAQGNVVIIGCTKLDATIYSEKLAQIIANNAITSLHVVRMEVPCCGGMSHAVQEALRFSGKQLPYEETILSTEGVIL